MASLLLYNCTGGTTLSHLHFNLEREFPNAIVDLKFDRRAHHTLRAIVRNRCESHFGRTNPRQSESRLKIVSSRDTKIVFNMTFQLSKTLSYKAAEKCILSTIQNYNYVLDEA